MNDDTRRVQKIQERQIADAWHRIETWLRHHAPATVPMLRPGASEEQLDALQQTLGVRLPADLKALWRLCAGTYSVPGAAFLWEQWAPMSFPAVIEVYQRHMLRQQQQQRQQQNDDEFLIWRAAWIPVCAYAADDHTSGLYLDAETGRLGYWDRFGERRVEFESLTTYLEETADALETPALVTGYKPGLVNGALVWGPPSDPEQAGLWVPCRG
ncbi:SMI1/KNR4 family protein [Streptomyces sp. NPDC093510]|uniref:SMI1/KNR4 family protein n=1 Tax=Streptomyces sp. NPDC093510 TaxID=3155199 RepID=UPI00341BF9F9